MKESDRPVSTLSSCVAAPPSLKSTVAVEESGSQHGPDSQETLILGEHLNDSQDDEPEISNERAEKTTCDM